jgi:hypothetical protein
MRKNNSSNTEVDARFDQRSIEPTDRELFFHESSIPKINRREPFHHTVIANVSWFTVNKQN